MENYTKTTFKIFWKHAKKYKLVIFIMFFFILIATIAGTIAPLYFKKFFDILTGEGEVLKKVDLLKNILLINLLLVYAIEWIGWRVSTFSIIYFQSRTMRDIQNSCFSYLQKHSVSFFNNNFVGSLVKKVNRFSNSFEGLADIIVFDFFPLIISIIFITTVLALRNIFLGLAIFIWIIIYCLINYFFSIYKLKYDTERAKIDSKVTGVLADTVTNHLNIKLFASYNREKDNFEENTSALQKIRSFCWNLGNTFDSIQALLMVGLEIGVLYVAVNLWEKGIATIGDFALIQGYLLIVFQKP